MLNDDWVDKKCLTSLRVPICNKLYESKSALLPSDVIEIAAMLRSQRFWREIVSFLDVT